MPACHAGDRRFESGRVRHHRISLRPVRPPGRGVLLSAGSIRAVKRGPLLLVLGLLAIAIALPITGGELGFGSAAASPSAGGARRRPRPPSATAAPDGPRAAVGIRRRRVAERLPVGAGRHARAARRRRDRAGHPVPDDRHGHHAQGGRRRARRDEHALRRARARGGRDGRDPRGPRGRPAVRRVAARRGRLGQGAHHGPREEPQAARVPARRRGRPGRPRAGVGRQDALRRRPRDRPRRLAADRHAARGGGRRGLRPGATWTLVAGGDIMLDRGVAQTLKIKGKGADFPFDGGTADITSRYCCSSFGWDLPRTARTGDAGAMRDLIDGADLAIANFENPAPERVPLPHVGDGLLGRPEADQGAGDRRASTGSASPTTTSATRAARGSSRRSRTSRRTGSRRAARARTSRPRASRRCSRRTA